MLALAQPLLAQSYPDHGHRVTVYNIRESPGKKVEPLSPSSHQPCHSSHIFLFPSLFSF